MRLKRRPSAWRVRWQLQQMLREPAGAAVLQPAEPSLRVRRPLVPLRPRPSRFLEPDMRRETTSRHLQINESEKQTEPASASRPGRRDAPLRLLTIRFRIGRTKRNCPQAKRASRVSTSRTASLLLTAYEVSCRIRAEDTTLRAETRFTPERTCPLGDNPPHLWKPRMVKLRSFEVSASCRRLTYVGRKGKASKFSSCNFAVPKTARHMVLHHPGCLHKRVANRRADEGKAALF
ncbi:MAG: hypothetical protein K0Q94_6608 [Paenibacillus sp.]|nr:hypothetical protein [Paenibacillus sp.]